jgi:excisionase family DNA binding protein
MAKLPQKELFRVGEVADYFGVTDRTVYLWIEHGHLKTEQTPAGQFRVTKESLDKCRFQKRDAQNV